MSAIALSILMQNVTVAHAENKVFVKEYTYQASEQDSKITCRKHAIEQVKHLLLEELGSYIESYTEVSNLRLTHEEIVSITSGTVRTEIIDERWDGSYYSIKANLTADPDEVCESIKKNRPIFTKGSNRVIKQNKEYRIKFHSADIEPGPYSNDDSNPGPDAYVVVTDGKGKSLFNSGDVYLKQKNTRALLGNRNNFLPDFCGAGFKRNFSSGCISVSLMDWDGCEGFLCSKSSEEDVIGSELRMCVGDKIGKRWAKGDGWQMEMEIIPAE